MKTTENFGIEQVEVCQCSCTDAEAIANIAMENFSGYRGDNTLEDRERVIEEFNGRLGNFPTQQIFSALVPSQNTQLPPEFGGYIVWERWGGCNRPDGDNWELKSMAVKESLRKNGIGRKLVMDSLNELRKYIHSRDSWLKNIIIFTGSAKDFYEKIFWPLIQVVAGVDLYHGKETMLQVTYSKPRKR